MNPPEWLLSPWLWILLLLFSHVVMLIIFVRYLSSNVAVAAWHEGYNACLQDQRDQEKNSQASRRLPLLDSDLDPEAALDGELMPHHHS